MTASKARKVPVVRSPTGRGEFLSADLAGLYQAFSDSKGRFGETLRLIIAILGAPAVVAAGFISEESTDFLQLPRYLGGVALVVALLGYLGVVILVHYRVTQLEYVYWLNRFRIHALGETAYPEFMAEKARTPQNKFEPTKPMGVIVLAVGILSAAYFSVGGRMLDWWHGWLLMVMACVGFVAWTYLTYMHFARFDAAARVVRRFGWVDQREWKWVERAQTRVSSLPGATPPRVRK